MASGNRTTWIVAGSVIAAAVAIGGGFLLGRASEGAAESPTPPTTDATGPTGASGPTGPTDSPSSEPTPTPPPTIEDGRHFTFLSAIDTGDPTTITFDLAYFLTGDEATQAAAERGDESPPPNDYYIINDNPKLRTVPVADDAQLLILDWSNCCDDHVTGSLDDMAAAMASGDDPYGGTYRYTSPFWLTVEDGEIVSIEEQYLP